MLYLCPTCNGRTKETLLVQALPYPLFATRPCGECNGRGLIDEKPQILWTYSDEKEFVDYRMVSYFYESLSGKQYAAIYTRLIRKGWVEWDGQN